MLPPDLPTLPDPSLAVAMEGGLEAAAGSAFSAEDGSALARAGSARAATTIRGVQEELLQGVVFYGGVDVAQAAGMAPASSDGGHGTRTRHGRPRRRGSAGAWRRRRGVAA